MSQSHALILKCKLPSLPGCRIPAAEFCSLDAVTAALPPGGFPFSWASLVLIVWGLSHCLLSGVHDIRWDEIMYTNCKGGRDHGCCPQSSILAVAGCSAASHSACLSWEGLQLCGLQPAGRWALAQFEWTCLCLNAGVEEVQSHGICLVNPAELFSTLGIGVGWAFWVLMFNLYPDPLPLGFVFLTKKIGCPKLALY